MPFISSGSRCLAALLAIVSVLAAADNPGIAAAGVAVQLFNGKDLTGFDTLIHDRGLNNDPNHVFQVENGMLHVSGAEFGYLITKREYGNYYLRSMFKWGEKTYPPRLGNARDSGILFHVTGPHKVWPRSLEFQMIEGGTGDIIMTGSVLLKVKDVIKSSGRFDRFGKGAWEDVTGYRDPGEELEKAHGEWNTLELLADGNHIKYWVNGKLANEGSDAELSRGKILFQSEGAEVVFRDIELRPLKPPTPAPDRLRNIAPRGTVHQ